MSPVMNGVKNANKKFQNQFDAVDKAMRPMPLAR
jgi:hypothetical protein